jgi:hypothetical protein
MALREITLPLPESLYIRLKQIADATEQSLIDIALRAVQIGSPPGWEDAPAEFQTELAALDRLDDTSLWHVARAHQSEADATRYQALLDNNAAGSLAVSERDELNQLRQAADRLMLRKAHAAALLRWRGHVIPPADKLR